MSINFVSIPEYGYDTKAILALVDEILYTCPKPVFTDITILTPTA